MTLLKVSLNWCMADNSSGDIVLLSSGVDEKFHILSRALSRTSSDVTVACLACAVVNPSFIDAPPTVHPNLVRTKPHLSEGNGKSGPFLHTYPSA